MPAPKKKPDQRITGAPQFVDDVSGPYQEITALGHSLVLDGEHFDVNLAARWQGWPAKRQELIDAGNADEVDALLFRLFADALLPSNPDWTEAKLRETFPWQAQIAVLRHFFSWRLSRMLLGEGITVTRTVRAAPQLQDVSRTG